MKTILLCTLLLSACAVNPEMHSNVIADVQAARDIACANDRDPLGCTCYVALDAHLQTSDEVAKPIGPISALERVRVARQGIPIELKQACGGLLLDARLRILNVAGLIAGLKP